MNLFSLNKSKKIPEGLEHHFFTHPELSAEEVVERLSADIDALHKWLINFGDRYSPATFFEKSQLLIDKMSERDKFEKLIALEREEDIN